MNKLACSTAWVAGALLTFSMMPQALAESADAKWLVRTTVIGVNIDAKSRVLRLDADDTVAVALDVTHFFTPNIGLGVLATFLNTEVSAAGLGSLGSVDVLPPIVTLQWHFAPQAQVRPYVGLGFNYNVFSNESGTLRTINTHIDNTFGFVAQVGLDYMLDKRLSLNADLKYLTLDADVKTNLGNDELELDAFIVGVGLGYRF